MHWKPTRGSLLQSSSEWEARNRILAETLIELISLYIHPNTNEALEVGAQRGALTDLLSAGTELKWWGIDPMFKAPTLSRGGAELLPGWAHHLPFPDSHFDCVILANVYEHIQPELRSASFNEIRRVLDSEGILVGQLPNPHFLIESHSRLPFMAWLPRRIQLLYWRLAPVPWEHDFFVVKIKELKARAAASGFKALLIRNFNYPSEAIPHSFRWAVPLMAKAMQFVPWAWQFVFKKV